MITKELRKYVWDKVPSKHLEDLIDIADAIEQKHEEELVQGKADVLSGCVSVADDFIELPKDADGEIIRLGNVLEWQGASFTVEVLELDEEGWWTRHDGFSVKCSDARHAQPDSWEAIIEAAVDYGDKRLFTGTKGDKANIAELVERCKHCRKFSLDNSDHDYRSGWWCDRWDTDMVEPDGFCAWGERAGDAL